MRHGLQVLFALSLATPGCSSLPTIGLGSSLPAEGAPGHVAGFLGGVVADEPRAALAAREVLSAGGTAADAAVALAFMLSVTLPSRAGLGGGGACLAYAPARSSEGKAATPDAILFLPEAPAETIPGGRPAAVPLLARGLYVLHARYGRRPFESLIVPAEQAARFGIPLSRALSRDLDVVAGPLLADPYARAAFASNGVPLAEGGTLIQPDLGSTLAQMRISGVGDLYQGALARILVDAAPRAGATLTTADLRAALPKWAAPLILSAGNDQAAFLPPPADGGLATAAAFQQLRANPGATEQAAARALSVAGRWRQGGVTDAASLLDQPLPAAALPPLPASTTFGTVDRNGNAVVCALTMNNLFGTGRIAPGTGILLAASPAFVPPPLLSAVLVYNTNLPGFRVLAGGSGQEGAPVAAADAIVQELAQDRGFRAPTPAPDPGRSNVIACSRYLPADDNSCGWATDPRGAGLAIGSN